MIHLVGDSHISFFPQGGYARWCTETLEQKVPYVGDYDPDFRTMHLGPLLAHSFVPGREEYDWVHANLPQDARVLFVMGEIDCRRHLRVQAREQGKGIGEVCADLANRYTKALEGFSNGKRRIGLMSPHMTLCEGGGRTDIWLDRQEVLNRFEISLQANCNPFGFSLFSINRHLVSHGFEHLRSCLWEDECHLSGELRGYATSVVREIMGDQ